MDKSPPSLEWMVRVASEAVRFFSLDMKLRSEVQREQKIEAPAGKLVPFSLRDFMTYLHNRSIDITGRRAVDLENLLSRMASVGILHEAGAEARSPMFSRCYILAATITRLQSAGRLWLSPVIGPQLLIDFVGPRVAYITGTTKEGDSAGGSGLLIDSEHILTAAHVVNDMNLDESVMLGQGVLAALQEVVIVDNERDVAVIKVRLPSHAAFPGISGLAFRDPQWADGLTLVGYPPVPTTARPYITMQTGEVVNPCVETVIPRGELFLYSAVARPGNSGGPILANDGRVVGLVTRGLESNNNSTTSPFFAGVPTHCILAALAQRSYASILPVEDWA
jgi:S1-C subfamily serine protease